MTIRISKKGLNKACLAAILAVYTKTKAIALEWNQANTAASPAPSLKPDRCLTETPVCPFLGQKWPGTTCVGAGGGLCSLSLQEQQGGCQWGQEAKSRSRRPVHHGGQEPSQHPQLLPDPGGSRPRRPLQEAKLQPEARGFHQEGEHHWRCWVLEHITPWLADFTSWLAHITSWLSHFTPWLPYFTPWLTNINSWLTSINPWLTNINSWLTNINP